MSERLLEMYEEMKDKDNRIRELEAENKELVDVNCYEYKRAEAAEAKVAAGFVLAKKWQARYVTSILVEGGVWRMAANELEAALSDKEPEQ